MKRRALWLDLVIVVVLAGATWFTRAYAANTFVTWDEPAWVYRSVHFLDALRRGDWASTLLVGHPGVITMWCGAGGLTWHTLVTGVVSPDQLTPILAAPEFAVHDPELLRQLVALLPYAKSGIVVLHAGILVALYAVMACLLDRRYALVAALVVLLDPFYMALSRVLHIDALTSSFMVLAVLSALVYCRRGQRWALVLSGVAGAMAALAKAYGVVAAPIVAGVLAWQMVGPRRTSSASSQGPDGPRIKLWLRALALWTLVALGSALVLWPALWASPLETVRGMVSLSFEYATDPGDATTSFFRGAMTTHPGLAFYPFAMYFRTTPLTLLGLVTALIGTVWQRGSERARWSRRTMLGLLAFAALYLGLISFAGKKFDRYALPALVALDIVAAVGWVGLLDGLAARLRGLQSRLLGSADSRILRVLPTTILCALLAGQGIWLLAPLGPAYYLSYYNPWAGGLVRAVETLPIGWGEGVERMGGYLSAKEDAADLVVATWAVAGIAPGFPGQVVVLTPEGIPQADYIVLYRGDVRAQQDLVAQLGEPEHVVEIGGVPYVWLYANTYHHDLTARIAEDLGGDDVVIANTLSLLDRQESGLEVTVLHGDSEGEIAEQLRRATRGASGLLYVSFNGIPDPHGYIGRQLAQNTLYLGEERFSMGTIRRLELVPNATFAPADPVALEPGMRVRFGDQLILEGVGLSSDEVEYRQELGLALRWQVSQPLGEDYHLFVHLVDEYGNKWGQRDRPLEDIEGTKTSQWAPGSSHTCRYTLPLQAGVSPGSYRLVLGVYRMGDYARLQVNVPDAEQNGTAYPATLVRVRVATVPPDVADLPIAHHADVDLGHGMQLVGYSLGAPQVRSGDDLALSLCWRCRDETDRDLLVNLRLTNGDAVAADLDTSPIGAHYGTSQWRQGDIFCTSYVLVVSPEAESGSYGLDVALHAEGEAAVEAGVRLTEVMVEHSRRLFDVPSIAHSERYRLGDICEFLGYDLTDDRITPGGQLHFTLYWRALAPTQHSFKVFTHLLDNKGGVRGQRDSAPMGGGHPTNEWVEGEVIVDPYEITVDANAQPGRYRLQVGMYDPATGVRLSIADAEGKAQAEDRILLREGIRVAR